MVLIEDMDKEIAVLFGHADVGVVALHGDEFAVFGDADGVEQGAQIYTVAVELVDPDPTAMKALPIEGGQNLFGELEGNVDADGLLFGVLVVHTNVEPTVLLGRRIGRLGGIYRVLGRFGRVALSDAGDWRECECGSNDGCDSWKPSGAIEHGGLSPSRNLGANFGNCPSLAGACASQSSSGPGLGYIYEGPTGNVSRKRGMLEVWGRRTLDWHLS
jgi:hypothetical protein